MLDEEKLKLSLLRRKAENMSLADCIYAASQQNVKEESIMTLAQAIVEYSKAMGYDGIQLTAACAFICINQTIIDHTNDIPAVEAPKGFFHG
jgi:hypothetical protein